MHQLPICREKETEQEKERKEGEKKRERELQSILVILITNALSDSHHGMGRCPTAGYANISCGYCCSASLPWEATGRWFWIT